MIFLGSEFKKIKNLVGTKITEVNDMYPGDKYDDSFTLAFENGESLEVYEYRFWGF